MKSTINDFAIPATANYVRQGSGSPVIMIHGVAASLHDWDDLIPDLTKNGYTSYALDLLGHGDSPKPNSRAYHIDWVFEHFLNWITSLCLTEPAIIIGHSLGGYIALEYARRFSAWTRSLILVNPFYSLSQLPFLLRRTYRHPKLSGLIAQGLPEWMFRMVVDFTSIGMGHNSGAVHALPERIRAQTALDYTRTASGVYNVPNTMKDLTDILPSISTPALIVWGERDQTLAPSSFLKMMNNMPRAEGKTIPAGHVPHQSNVREFNEMVVKFLRRLG
ncbi:MAG TPA: alpha/beta hydrolase [Anaerolineales bacterium]